MSELVVNETHNDLIIAGDDNQLDVVIVQHDVMVDGGHELTVLPVEVNLELSTDDLSLDIVEQSIEVLTVGAQGPAGPAGSGGGAALQTIFEQLGVDNGFRGDSALGTLTSQPLWQVVKIIIQEDGTPMELYADGDDAFVHIWDDRAGFNY
ncbi:MAG: hypothetical protein COA83_09635 [Methylophaga sp.]|nr:MAG: hypothetical protein COA83_09635 [Methylophaga sp.]